MLTICIPTYNYDVRSLVNELKSQAETSKIEVEIIVADDASNNRVLKKFNKEIESLSNVSLYELEQNIGRSAIRNYLFQKAKFNFLLFLDCDTFPENSNFIKKYCDNRQDNGVVVGGLVYREELINSDFSLRWHYGRERETISAKQRRANPYGSFMTGNFMIAKSVFQLIQFDESIKGYGHEDTLFGISIERQGIGIFHIENRVYHDGLETNIVFIEKTKKGIESLLAIYLKDKTNRVFITKNKLLKTFLTLKKWGAVKLIAFWFRRNETRILKELSSKKPSIRTFDWFKLGYICSSYLKYKKL